MRSGLPSADWIMRSLNAGIYGAAKIKNTESTIIVDRTPMIVHEVVLKVEVYGIEFKGLVSKEPSNRMIG